LGRRSDQEIRAGAGISKRSPTIAVSAAFTDLDRNFSGQSKSKQGNAILKVSQIDADAKRQAIVDAAEDKKANYITTLNLRGKSLIADFFIICSGTSNVHIRSIADGVMEAMEKLGIRQSAIEGYSEGAWVLVDYGDVVVHVMSEEHRSFYKLEGLWGAAAEVAQEAAPNDSEAPAKPAT
jgi:ribosome-associated protein